MAKHSKTEIELGEFSDVDSSDSEESNGGTSDNPEISEDEDEVARYTINPSFMYDEATGMMRRKTNGTDSNSDDELVPIIDSSDDSDDQNVSWTGTFTGYTKMPSSNNSFTLNGLAAALTIDSTPLNVLRTFLTDDIIEEICTETNRYAKVDNQKNEFEDVTAGEMWNFLGLQILAGIIRKPSIKSYFSTDPVIATSYFNSIFSRNRFEEILRYLHLADNSKIDNVVVSRTCKFGNVVPKLLKAFKNNVRPGQQLCLDESLIKYLGRLSIKQFIRTKRSRFGVKMFVLSDSTMNYVLDTLLYQGEKTELTVSKNDYGVGAAVVLTMIETYANSGRNIFLDNWFTSVTLATKLLEVDTFMCGTTRRNRKGLPYFISRQNKEGKGFYKSYFNGTMSCERWQDRKEVLMLSTFVVPGQTSVTNKRGSVQDKPNSVIMYNKYMGSTDFIDKQLKPYEIIRKTYKWYKKIFFWYIDVTIWNSFVIFNSLQPDTKQLTFLDYKLNLIKEIQKTFEPKRKCMGRPVVLEPLDSTRKTGQHWPAIVKGSGPKQCVVCSKHGTRRRSMYQCDRCQVTLCIIGCFKEYHICH